MDGALVGWKLCSGRALYPATGRHAPAGASDILFVLFIARPGGGVSVRSGLGRAPSAPPRPLRSPACGGAAPSKMRFPRAEGTDMRVVETGAVRAWIVPPYNRKEAITPIVFLEAPRDVTPLTYRVAGRLNGCQSFDMRALPVGPEFDARTRSCSGCRGTFRVPVGPVPGEKRYRYSMNDSSGAVDPISRSTASRMWTGTVHSTPPGLFNDIAVGSRGTFLAGLAGTSHSGRLPRCRARRGGGDGRADENRRRDRGQAATGHLRRRVGDPVVGCT